MSMVHAADRWKRLIAWLLILALFFVFVYHIRTILLPFVVGALTAYFLDPAADRLQRLGASRTMATIFITVWFFSLLLLAGILVAPLLVEQLGDLVEALPGYLADLERHYGDLLASWIERIQPGRTDALQSAFSNVGSGMLQVIGGVLTGVFYSGAAVVNLLSLLLITPLVSFYLLRDWDNIKLRLDRLLPRASAPVIREQLHRINETLAGFVRGQMNVCFLLGLYYAALLSIIGLHFGLVIGLATGLLVILPYVGFLFGFVIACVIAFLQFGLEAQTWLVVAVFMGGQILESYFLTPRLVGNRVGLHPLWIIFGMLAGAALFGFVGVLLAVPLTAIIGVLIRFAIERYLQSPLYRSV